MHQSFGDWYRAATIKPDGEDLKKRWVGVHQFDPSRAYMLELARLFFGLGKPSEKFLQDFRNVFQEADPAFPVKDNDLELRLLAGAELADCWFSHPGPRGYFATLLVLCGSVQGKRPAIVPDIVTLAAQQLSAQCIRRFNAASLGTPAKFEAKAISALKGQLAQNNTQSLAEPFVALTHEVTRLQKVLGALQQRLALQAEETNMLWWMLGEHGRDADKHLAALPPAVVPLTVGIDLADLVEVLPGPMAVVAFLNRALRLTEAKPDTTLRLRDCIAAVSTEEREKWVEADRWTEALGEVCAIHDTLKLSLASSQKEAWLPAFQERTGFTEDFTMSAQELAYQAYLEVLLDGCWRALA